MEKENERGIELLRNFLEKEGENVEELKKQAIIVKKKMNQFKRRLQSAHKIRSGAWHYKIGKGKKGGK